MNVLTCISSCLFRNKHTLIKIGRAMSYRFQDTSLRFHTLPTRCIAESRCIRDKTTLLGINTLRIHIVPRRNFLKMDPELKPLLKSKPEKDGLCMKKYELIYVSDSFLAYKRAGDFVMLMSLIILPWLCYSVYMDSEKKNVKLSKPSEMHPKYQSLIGLVFINLFCLTCFYRFRRSPYRIYKERSSHGLNSQYLAIMPDRLFFTKQLRFGLLDYKELPKPQKFTRSLLLGNAYIKQKSYVIFEDCFVSSHFHNEINGFLL